ncbi:MAG: hypothetical protein GXY46_04110 [Actinobacteria bacterium]|nr:hypothetical protein [Actinomycetota bacterium]
MRPSAAAYGGLQEGLTRAGTGYVLSRAASGPPGTTQTDVHCTVAAFPFKEDKRRIDVGRL